MQKTKFSVNLNKMRTKIALVSCIALFAILAMSLVSADELSLTNFQVSFNGMTVSEGSNRLLTAFAGERIPLEVLFASNESVDVEDATVSAWIAGHRDEISAETSRFRIVSGAFYDKLLVLEIPSDLEEFEDRFTLVVMVEGKSKSKKVDFNINLQRESFRVEALSVEVAPSVKVGDNLEISVVAKNIGLRKLQDVFAVIKVPGLSLQRTVYMSDLFADDHDNEDEEDAAERSVLLDIPENAEAGTYSMEIVVHNADASTKTILREFRVVGVETGSEVFVPISSKTASIGQEVTYDIVILNRGSKTAVYEVVPQISGSAFVSVDSPIIAVSGDSSRTVKASFRAQEAGTYTFSVNVNSEGKLVKAVSLASTVSGRSAAGTSITSDQGIVVLTIVLAIIFVVLLVVLLVLLTRKPKKEGSEETYY